MQPYPLLFEPILKPKVWGGRFLEKLGKQLPPNQPVGESWEIADLPEAVSDGRSIIANGELAGQTLRQAIQKHHDEILGAAPLVHGGFPLLIKYLDARENLSVQVHPTPTYVASHPDAHLKSEAWVVIHAEPGSVIYKGIKPHITARQFAQHVRDGSVVHDLVAIEAKPGECHYLPSGTCHALGAGVVVAEIQTPSDTTFRVYDWGRASRDLHVDQALQCIDFGTHQAHKLPKPHKPIEVRGVRTTPLATTEYFEIDRVDSLVMARFPIVTSGMPEVWMWIAQTGRIECGTGPAITLDAGTTVLVPAGLSGFHATLSRGAWMLRVRLPSPVKGMIV